MYTVEEYGDYRVITPESDIGSSNAPQAKDFVKHLIAQGHLRSWLQQGVPFLDGAGCRKCSGIGYRGRVGVHELLMVNGEMQGLISRGADDQVVAEAAGSGGYRRLWWDGLAKVVEGVTTLRELSSSITPDLTEQRGGFEGDLQDPDAPFR